MNSPLTSVVIITILFTPRKWMIWQSQEVAYDSISLESDDDYYFVLFTLRCEQPEVFIYCIGPVFGAVRALAVLRNCEANKREMLWRGTYAPYLHVFFCFFQNFEIWNFNDFFFFFCWHRTLWECKLQPISFHIFFLFFNQLLKKIPSHCLHKSWHPFFEIPNLKVFKTDWNFR